MKSLFGKNLRPRLSIAKAELKKGPAMFPYHTDVDYVQRGFGASASRLNKVRFHAKMKQLNRFWGLYLEDKAGIWS